jgi:N-succinyldiaminopimelate aminotransferase
MNPDLRTLEAYPFEKLAQLKQGITPPSKAPIALSIGEPQQATPDFILQALSDNLAYMARYPLTKGGEHLRHAIAAWLERRFVLPHGSLDVATQILPVNGTREALFSFAQAVINRANTSAPYILMPNPFYQIYEGAAILAGAQPWFINNDAHSGGLANFDDVAPEVWQRCQLLYICSPNNPTGAVLSIAQLQNLIHKADEYDFVIASDECYSELYFDETQPPPGLLQAAAALGRHDYRRCVVFHSLSKRSNAPGLRSGFVAGDGTILRDFLLYRTYHGCAMSLPIQAASSAAWEDEHHVRAIRQLYRQKFIAVHEILAPVVPCSIPPASFYLWLPTPIEDTEFTRELFAREHVTVLPGSYLSRQAHGVNPGSGWVRIALVAELEECIEAAHRIRRVMENLG